MAIIRAFYALPRKNWGWRGLEAFMPCGIVAFARLGFTSACRLILPNPWLAPAMLTRS